MTNDESLEFELKRRTRFAMLRHPASCESTQDLAAAQDADDPNAPVEAVFWADHQTRGRGRQQRAWSDGAGLDLAATFRFRAAIPRPVALPAALPVAILQAAEPFAGVPLRLKWPNDVYSGERKLAGVLVDRDSRQPDVWRVGVGLNVNSTRFAAELERHATSLAILAGRALDRRRVLLAVAERIDRVVAAVASDDCEEHEQWFRERLGLLGREVELTADRPLRGTLTAIDFDRLMLDGDDGEVAVPLAIVQSLRAIARSLLLLLPFLLAAACASDPGRPVPAAPLCVMTWNIHHGRGLALELELAQRLGMQVAFGENLDYQGGDYGNAVLSRPPIGAAHNHHYTMLRAGEQRGLLRGGLKVTGARVPATTASDHRPLVVEPR